jgi:hypothetical protein
MEERTLGEEQFMGRRFVEYLPKPALDFAEGAAKLTNSKAHFMVQRVTDRLRPPQETVNQLYEALKASPLMGAMQGKDGAQLPTVTDVITGHTHTQYMDIVPDGASATAVRFHNTGTALEPKRFQPVMVEGKADQRLAITAVAMQQVTPRTLGHGDIKLMRCIAIFQTPAQRWYLHAWCGR